MITKQNETKNGTGMFTFGGQQTCDAFKPALAFSNSGGSDPIRDALNALYRKETVSLATSPSISRTSTLANQSETSDSLEIPLEESKSPVFGLATPLGPKPLSVVKGMYLTLYIPLYAGHCSNALYMST